MITIYDVARAAGVSPKTVSRVLNGDAPVKAETAELVRRVIAELGYAPSSAARAMRSNKSGLIGLITVALSADTSMPENTGLPDLFIVQGVQKAMEASGKTLLIADSGGRADRVADLMRTFEQHRVEGIIHVSDHHRRVTLPPVSAQTRLVLVNGYDEAATPCVLPDDRKGQRMLTADLIARGHRRIAYITLNAAMDATRLRTQGYHDALGAAGISVDPALVVVGGIGTTDHDAEVQVLWDAIDRVLALDAPPTVICFGNDQMAMRAYGILRSRGLSLPDDISVAGYDNHRMITQTLYPTLTSAELPYHAMGVRATQLLLRMIDDAADLPDAPVLVSGPVHVGQSVRTLPTPITKLTSIGRTTQ